MSHFVHFAHSIAYIKRGFRALSLPSGRVGVGVAFMCCCMCTHAQTYQSCVERGLSQLEHDSLVQAEASFREAMMISPALKSNALLFRHIGQIQERTGRDHDALESYSLGLNIAPNTQDLLLDRASLYFRLGNDDRAIADYTSVLDNNADHPEALFFRAYLYSRRRDYKKARFDYEHLLKVQPVREDALQGLCILNSKDSRPREAMEQVNNLIQLFPTHGTNYVIRGGMELDEKRYEAALYDFDKAISLDPNNPDFLLSRADCYTKMRKKKQARQDLQQALQLGADKQVVADMFRLIK